MKNVEIISGHPFRLGSKRRARFSIRSHGSVRSRFSREVSIPDGPDESGGDIILESGHGDENGIPCGDTSEVTVQTTKEQSESNILSWLNEPGKERRFFSVVISIPVLNMRRTIMDAR